MILDILEFNSCAPSPSIQFSLALLGLLYNVPSVLRAQLLGGQRRKHNTFWASEATYIPLFYFLLLQTISYKSWRQKSYDYGLEKKLKGYSFPSKLISFPLFCES